MKKIFLFYAILALMTVTGCDPYNSWPDGLEELEHVYYIGFVKTGQRSADPINYYIWGDGTSEFQYREHYNQSRVGGTSGERLIYLLSDEDNMTYPVPFRFVSEYVRSYDATTYFWIETSSGTLVEGTDYEVYHENGARLQPGSPAITNRSGPYSLTWPQAKKDVQNVKIKRTSTATGNIRVVLLDRTKFAGNDLTDRPDRNKLEQLVNSETNDYIVRGFWFDYNNGNTSCSVNIQFSNNAYTPR